MESRSRFDEFMAYLGPKDSLAGYQRSYKLVFYKCFFSQSPIRPYMPAKKLAEAFRTFYVERVVKGLIPEVNADDVITNVMTSSVDAILSLILRNPYNAVHNNGFFNRFITNGEDSFVLDTRLFYELNPARLDEINSIINEKLIFYYSHVSADAVQTSKLNREVLAVVKPKVIRNVNYQNQRNNRVKKNVIINASAFTDKEMTVKYQVTSPKTGRRLISDYDKLKHRIEKEFDRKRFIGDISINDDEFDILIDYLQVFYDKIRVLDWNVCADKLVCTAMVQVGIRYYDGGYWPHFSKIIDRSSWNTNRQVVFGNVCVRTLKEAGKYTLEDSDRINTILMHGFVSDKYAANLFDFLFAYYRIDLERDLSRNDRDTMRELIRSIQNKDNSNRTYKLVRQTSDAVVSNPRGCNTRLRWLLRMMDASFWGDDIYINPNNRLSKRFSEWASSSRDFQNYSGSRGSKQRAYSSPHILMNMSTGSFSLRLPAQNIRTDENVYWICNYGLETKPIQVDVDTYESVLGFKTEPVVIAIPAGDIFSRFTLELHYGDSKKRFYIPQEDSRFFNTEGYSVNANSLKPGEYYAFTAFNKSLESNAIIEKRLQSGLSFYYFTFEEGDIVKLTDGTAVCIGRRIQEGLLTRGSLNGITEATCGCVVYDSVPSILIKTLPERLQGTAITINDKKLRLVDHFQLSEVTLDEGSHEKGYWFALSDAICKEDGIYRVDIDIPNDRSIRKWEYALIRGLKYHFEGSLPYVYESRGVICFSNSQAFQISPEDERIIPDREHGYYNFEIHALKNQLDFSINQVSVRISIPQFEYSFDGEEWFTYQYPDIWHGDFPRRILIHYPDNSITLELINHKEDDLDNSENFSIRHSDMTFDCDLTRFRSWFNDKLMRNALVMKASGKRIPLFSVVVRSFVSNCSLTADADENQLILQTTIIGKGKYYFDLLFKGEQLVEKQPLYDGENVIQTAVRNGAYNIRIFEESAEDDFSFDEVSYQQIYSANTEIINPYDLTGRSVELTHIKKDVKDLFSSKLNQPYLIRDLKLIDEKDRYRYSGQLIINENGDTVPAVFELLELKNLMYAYVLWVDTEYEEETQLLYDEETRALVCEEDRNLKTYEQYRRYVCLFTDEYLFGFRFITKGKQGQ